MKPFFSFPLWFSVVALGLFVGAGGCATRPDAKDEAARPTRLRVMTYNIHHGVGLDGRLDLERIAALIRAERADIVALQEVDRGTERTERRDLAGELGQLLGMHVVFENNHAFQGGEYGNALLSRFPVREFRNRHFRMTQSTEQRGLLQVLLEVEGKPLLIMNTHLDFAPDDRERLSHVEEIFEAWEDFGAELPVLLMGDFNDVPESRTHRTLGRRFDDLWEAVGTGYGDTIPVESPRRRIDWILASKTRQIVPIRAWVPFSRASDHLPVVVEIWLRN
jgi:endonuclease/exonuclease/phosphatase family metal-dependent hydrolase